MVRHQPSGDVERLLDVVAAAVAQQPAVADLGVHDVRQAVQVDLLVGMFNADADPQPVAQAHVAVVGGPY